MAQCLGLCFSSFISKLKHPWTKLYTPPVARIDSLAVHRTRLDSRAASKRAFMAVGSATQPRPAAGPPAQRIDSLALARRRRFGMVYADVFERCHHDQLVTPERRTAAASDTGRPAVAAEAVASSSNNGLHNSLSHSSKGHPRRVRWADMQ